MRALVMALVLVACATQPEAQEAPVTHQLEGTRWVFNGVRANAPSIEFADGRASGSTGCNRWFGQVIAGDPAALSFEGVGSTRMACDDWRMQVEQNFLQILGETEIAFVHENGLLFFRDSAGADIATFSRSD